MLPEDNVIQEGWDDGFEGLRHEAQAGASQSVSQASSPELTAIERELEVWNQVIQGPKKQEIDIDILSFWKKTEASLPLLSWLARRVLCIPASSTASERAFSTGGKVVSSSRTLLNVDHAEDLIWLRKNFDVLDPLVEKYVLRRSDYQKIEKARKKEADKKKGDKEAVTTEKEKEKKESSSESQTSSESEELSEARYSDDDNVESIHDSDDY